MLKILLSYSVDGTFLLFPSDYGTEKKMIDIVKCCAILQNMFVKACDVDVSLEPKHIVFVDRSAVVNSIWLGEELIDRN